MSREVAFCSAKTYYAGFVAPAAAIDGVLTGDTGWVSNGEAVSWWQVQFVYEQTITSYSITCQDLYLTRNITAWMFKGSNDGTTWATLDTQSGITWSTGQVKDFSFANSTPYLMYRVDITANGGSPYSTIMEITFGGLAAHPTPYEVLTASDTYPTVLPSDAVNGVILGDVGWVSNAGMPTWLQVKFLIAHAVISYTLVPSGYNPNRSPKDWTFSGSNDGSSWTTLDTQTGITSWPALNSKTFIFANTTTYTYYRINVTANQGDSYTSIAEIAFGGLNAATPPPPTSPILLGGVQISALATVAAAFASEVDLGLVSVGTTVDAGAILSLGLRLNLTVGPTVTMAMPQPGTLANPFAASENDSRLVDFANSLYVATDPSPATGPDTFPSFWYRFTALSAVDWTALSSGFAVGAVLELFTGPVDATAADLTFIGTDGVNSLMLAATITTESDIGLLTLDVESVDLGAVAMDGASVLVVALT